MYIKMLLASVFSLCLSSCAQNTVASADPDELTIKRHEQLSAKCEHAKGELDRSVKDGQLSGLHELKRNIELYCVWRNY